MMANDDLEQLLLVATRCAIGAVKRLPADVVEDILQETWVRFLRACLHRHFPDEPSRTGYFVGVFRNVCATVVRDFNRRRRIVALESEVGELLLHVADRSPRLGEAEIEAIARRCLSGLADADFGLWLAARVHGVGWRVAGELIGLEPPRVATARQRILRFLNAGDTFRRFLIEVGELPD